MESISNKSRLITFFLAFFFGMFGVHRFYVGKVGTGLLQLFTLGGFGIWALIDWIMIAAGTFTDGRGYKIIKWAD